MNDFRYNFFGLLVCLVGALLFLGAAVLYCIKECTIFNVLALLIDSVVLLCVSLCLILFLIKRPKS